MTEIEKHLEMQRDKYRTLQKSAPVGSGCWNAAKATADETQKALDWYAAQTAQHKDLNHHEK